MFVRVRLWLTIEEGCIIRPFSSVDKKYKLKYILSMKVFRWNNEKNIKLKKERGISFEDILFYIREGNLKC